MTARALVRSADAHDAERFRVIAGLVPGDRVRMRDWRDNSLVDGTHFGFYMHRLTARLLVGPAARVRESARVLLGLEPGESSPREPAVWAPAGAGEVVGRVWRVDARMGLCVHRDCFVGVRHFCFSDFVEKLDDGGPRGRAERLVAAVESLAMARAQPRVNVFTRETYTPKGCPGCLAYCEDQRVLDAAHDRGCLGVALVPEVAAALEELGVDPWARQP